LIGFTSPRQRKRIKIELIYKHRFQSNLQTPQVAGLVAEALKTQLPFAWAAERLLPSDWMMKLL
jgi:hypothetical protein